MYHSVIYSAIFSTNLFLQCATFVIEIDYQSVT